MRHRLTLALAAALVFGTTMLGPASVARAEDECGKWMPSRAFDEWTFQSAGSAGLLIGVSPSAAAGASVGGQVSLTGAGGAASAGATAGTFALGAAAFLSGMELGCRVGEATGVGGAIGDAAAGVLDMFRGPNLLESVPALTGVDDWTVGEKVNCSSFTLPNYTEMRTVLRSAGPIKSTSRKYLVQHDEPVYDDTGTPRANFFTLT